MAPLEMELVSAMIIGGVQHAVASVIVQVPAPLAAEMDHLVMEVASARTHVGVVTDVMSALQTTIPQKLTALCTAIQQSIAVVMVHVRSTQQAFQQAVHALLVGLLLTVVRACRTTCP
jgi:hypothetical protein